MRRITKSKSRLTPTPMVIGVGVGIERAFPSAVAQSLTRKSAGKPEPSTQAPPYGQRIALFVTKAVLLSPKSLPVQRASWFFNPAEAPRVQRVDADVAPFDVVDLA